MNHENDDSQCEHEPMTTDNIHDFPQWDEIEDDNIKRALNSILVMSKALAQHIEVAYVRSTRGLREWRDGDGPHYMSVAGKGKDTLMDEFVDNLSIWGALLDSLLDEGVTLRVESMSLDMDDDESEVELLRRVLLAGEKINHVLGAFGELREIALTDALNDKMEAPAYGEEDSA
jgi:hypothetical protein